MQPPPKARQGPSSPNRGSGSRLRPMRLAIGGLHLRAGRDALLHYDRLLRLTMHGANKDSNIFFQIENALRGRRGHRPRSMQTLIFPSRASLTGSEHASRANWSWLSYNDVMLSRSGTWPRTGNDLRQAIIMSWRPLRPANDLSEMNRLSHLDRP